VKPIQISAAGPGRLGGDIRGTDCRRATIQRETNMDQIATLTFEDVQLSIRGVTIDCSFYGEADFTRGRNGTFKMHAIRLAGARGATKIMTDVDDIPHAPLLVDWLWPMIVRQYASAMSDELDRLEREFAPSQSYAEEHRLRAYEVL
jgi:hypothetical protein